jgi:hypothetical protein
MVQDGTRYMSVHPKASLFSQGWGTRLSLVNIPREDGR